MSANKIFYVIGLIFTIIGLSILAIGITMCVVLSEVLILIIMGGIGVVFAIIGIVFLSVVAAARKNDAKIRNNGKKYAAKIIGFEVDPYYTINDQHPFNTQVAYYDDIGNIGRGLLKTRVTAGDRRYNIGDTVDIYVFEGKFTWNPDSVRKEMLSGEDALLGVAGVNAAGTTGAAGIGSLFGSATAAATMPVGAGVMAPAPDMSKIYVTECMSCGTRVDSKTGFIMRCPSCGGATKIV